MIIQQNHVLIQIPNIYTYLFDFRMVITATMADRSPPDLHLFRNYTAPQDMLGVAEYEHPELDKSPSRNLDMLVWRAARASGAAPSFFRPEGSYVDGGIISNNPAIDLLTEIAEYNIAQRATAHEDDIVEPTVLLSLGTGVPPVKKVVDGKKVQFFQQRKT